jgi:hypothetical protein
MKRGVISYREQRALSLAITLLPPSRARVEMTERFPIP